MARPKPKASAVKTLPRRVHWSQKEDFDVLVLGTLGFSTRFIKSQTGFTDCQVGYRLKKGDVKRATYRNGDSDIATMVLSNASNWFGGRRGRALAENENSTIGRLAHLRTANGGAKVKQPEKGVASAARTD